ncbi:E3 ubiquitin-protein ligase ATL6 [Dendrobium catenatum]|uniref:RING-type E3 ubiquitin transferase n=1 Tax=Dendrobium catenatum TaxID=906689 RepID=A0A2I0VJU0_9ASPA|nr:E3 ubiquitin-protein ligase ATL6 [Dendrobium catenatum]PKU63680.1 E3 ubiquitin-protein ligase ATL6 [Dendrobium catenatum]
MAATVHRPISPPRGMRTKSTVLITALMFLLTLQKAAAQQPPARSAANGDNPYNAGVSPALAILVVAIVSAFFLLGFFSIYLRRCSGDNSAIAPAILAGLGGGRSRRGTQRGLDQSLLETFPTMVYSSVKGQKLGKESLECAVCLCEFEEDDILRLLPRCSHVYHRDCIDVWFTTHVTCPVCRFNLAVSDEEPQPETADAVAISVEREEVVNGEDQHPDLADLVQIGSQRRQARSGSVKRIPMSSRSTGDWAAVVAASGGEGGDRFRLRLPEDVRRQILAAGQLRRSASFAVFTGRGEGSSRRGYRESVGRGWRSLRMGRSGRWPLFGRSFSARTAAEGSVSGSVKGGVVVPVKETNGDRGKTEDNAVISSAAFNLV